jgi:gamma-glutamylcyclotransferase (GGCT)/AIG2-like uncharacterized protein YtfP
MLTRFPNSKFIGEATANGRLFDLGAYPGLVSGQSKTPVIGEVYEIDDQVLNEMDQFEASSNYLRKGTEVSLGDETRFCWVYEPDPEYYSFSKLITEGDWVEYAKGKAK